MKTSPLRKFAALFATLLLVAPSGLRAGEEAPPPPTLADALRLKPSQALVLQPVQMQDGQTLTVTHTQFGDVAARPGQTRAIQLVIYSTRPDATGGNTVLFERVISAAPGAGPHVTLFDPYTATADQKGIIAILIGLLLPESDPTRGKSASFPKGSAFSAQIHDEQDGTTILLPAVQKRAEIPANIDGTR